MTVTSHAAPAAVTSFFVPGIPAPQGSKSYMGQTRAGKAILRESSSRVKPWRTDVRETAIPLFHEPAAGPVDLTLTFVFDRPKGHYRTGRNAHLLRAAAPTHPAVKPDIDKLARAVMDALTKVAYSDDSQVVALTLQKRYATATDPAGMWATVTPTATFETAA